MKVLGYEIRKLLTIRLLILFAVIFFIVYVVRLGFQFDAFPNGRPSLDIYNVTAEMVGEYGNRLNEEEFQDLKAVYVERVKVADEYLQSREEFSQYGVETYTDFEYADWRNEELQALHNEVMFAEQADIFWELQARRSLISDGEWAEERLRAGRAAGRELKIMETRIENGGIFPYDVQENYNGIMQYLSVIVLLGTVVIVSPIFLRDKMNDMQQLQYTTKIGRSLFKKKVWAALSVAALLTTFTLAVVFALYTQNNTAVFFKTPINSLFNFEVFWFDFTFFDYIILTVTLVYLLAFTAVILVAALSRIVPNYMTLIGVQIPVVILTIWLLFPLLIQNVTTTRLPIYFIPVIYGSLVLGSVILIRFSWHWEKRMDIL